MVLAHLTWACIITLCSMVISEFIFDDNEFGEKRTFGDPDSLVKRDSGSARVHVSEITRTQTFSNIEPLCSYRIQKRTRKLIYKSQFSSVTNGCTKIHLQSFLNNHFGGKDFSATFPNLNGNNFEVRKFSYQLSNKKVFIRAFSKSPVALFGGGNLQFGKRGDDPLKLEIRWTETTNSDAWDASQIEITLESSKVILSSASFNFQAKKMKNTDIFKIIKFDANNGVGSYTVTAFTSAIAGLDNTAFGADFSQDKYGRLKWPDFKGYGYFDTAENFQLVLHPTHNVRNTNLFNNEDTKQFIILSNPKEDDTTYVTLLVQFGSSTNIKDTLNGIMTSVNADIGIVKRINNRAFCLTVSSGKYDFLFIDLARDEAMMKPCFPLEFQDANDNPDVASKLKKQMTADINIHVEINFKQNVESCNSGDESIDTSSLPEKMTLNGNENWKGFTWTFPEQAKGPMMAAMKCMWSNHAANFAGLPYSLPFPNTDVVQISDLLDSPTQKTLSVKIVPPNGWVIPVLNVGFNYIEFTASYNIRERTWELSGAADMKINEFEVFLKLEYSHTTRDADDDDGDGKKDDDVDREPSKKQKSKNKNKNQGKKSGKESKLKAKLRKRKSLATLEELSDDFNKFSNTVVYDNMIIPRSLPVNNRSANVTVNKNVTMFGKKVNLIAKGSKRGMDEVEKQWTFTILMPTLLLKDIYKIFDSESEYPEKYPKVFENGIKNLQISWAWGSDFEIRFRGQLVIMGWDKLLLETVFWKQKPTNNLKFGIGIYFQEINLDAILKYIFQDDSISVPWLSKLDCKLVFGNSKGIKDLGGKKKKMKKMKSIKKVSKKKRKTNKSKSKTNVNALSRNTYKMKRYLSNELTGDIDGVDDDNDDDDGDEPEADIKFTYGSLADIALIRGAAFEMTWYRPTEEEACLGDKLCKFIYENVQANTQFVLAGAADSGGITISAELKDAGITLAEGLKLENAKLEIDVRVGGSIKLSCNLIYQNENIATNPLSLTGSIEVGFAAELTFRFTMGGTIDSPFGYDRIAFGNLLLGGTIDFKTASFTLEFGVTVMLGRLDQNPIVIKGYFGLNPINWIESWVYVKASKLTLGELGRAFDFQVEDGFKEEGFPEGFQFSLSRKEIDIDSLGIVIPSGLYVVGKFKFKFFELNADCTIDPANKAIDVKLEMNKQNWLGGMIQISSYTDENKGPTFHVKVDENTGLFANIDGSLTVLGLSQRTLVQINDNGANIRLEGTPFPFLFDAGLHITVDLDPVTKSFKGGVFKINVRSSSFIPTLTKKIKDWLLGLKSDGEEAKADGLEVVSEGESDASEIEEEKSGWDTQLDNWKTDLLEREKELKKKQQETLNSMAECISKCEEVCIPFFDWEPNCFTIFGYTFPCLWPNPCATKVPNYFCYAGCALDEIGSAFLTWVETTLTKIQLALQSAMVFLTDVVEGIAEGLEKLKNYLIQAKDWLIDQFATALDFVTDLLTKQIVLRKLMLEASVKPPFNFCFGYDIDITLFTWDHKSAGRVCLDTLIRDLIYSLFGLNADSKKVLDVPDQIEEAKSKIVSIKESSDALKESAQDAKAEIDRETAKTYQEDLTQRRTMPTPEMFKFIDEKSRGTKYSEEHQKIMDIPHGMPSYQIHNNEMLENLENSAPWVSVRSFKDGNNSLEPQRVVDHEVVKRSLSFGDASKPCSRLRRSLATYDTIANVLIRNARNLENMEKNHFSHKEFHRNGIKKLDKRIAELELNNMTADQREDAYFWYKKADRGYEDFHKIVRRNIDYHDNYALPILHNQLNYVLKKSGKEGGFIKHVEDMHSEALHDFKRSIKIEEDQNNGQKLLSNIKKDMLGIVSNDNIPLSRFTRSINGMKNDIKQMNKIALAC